jgi:hypothetical protein
LDENIRRASCQISDTVTSEQDIPVIPEIPDSDRDALLYVSGCFARQIAKSTACVKCKSLLLLIENDGKEQSKEGSKEDCKEQGKDWKDHEDKADEQGKDDKEQGEDLERQVKCGKEQGEKDNMAQVNQDHSYLSQVNHGGLTTPSEMSFLSCLNV